MIKRDDKKRTVSCIICYYFRGSVSKNAKIDLCIKINLYIFVLSSIKNCIFYTPCKHWDYSPDYYAPYTIFGTSISIKINKLFIKKPVSCIFSRFIIDIFQMHFPIGVGIFKPVCMPMQFLLLVIICSIFSYDDIFWLAAFVEKSVKLRYRFGFGSFMVMRS